MNALEKIGIIFMIWGAAATFGNEMPSGIYSGIAFFIIGVAFFLSGDAK